MNILIVEDDIDVSLVLMESIHHWGYSAENADTCEDALNKVKQKRFENTTTKSVDEYVC